MVKRVVYLIGEPGSGKTTLMRELMAPYEPTLHAKPFMHISYEHPTERVVQIGRDRGTFSGTDALSMGVQPLALAWLPWCDYDTILAEGDRLANDAFFKASEAAGGLILVHIDTPAVVCAARRAERGNQNESWVQGRITKTQKLLAKWAHITTHSGEAELLRRILWGEGARA
jgi:chloramphenicol 3-O-phosphotransferase